LRTRRDRAAAGRSATHQRNDRAEHVTDTATPGD
jgi:hypothetical protein